MTEPTRDERIIGLYKAGDSPYLIARDFNISPRQVQRIVKGAGVSRTQSESFRLAIKRGRMKYYRKPQELKRKRKTLSSPLRYAVLEKYGSRCAMCGRTLRDGIRVEIGRIDNDATHNTLDNLQVLCNERNHGKAMVSLAHAKEEQDRTPSAA